MSPIIIEGRSAIASYQSRLRQLGSGAPPNPEWESYWGEDVFCWKYVGGTGGEVEYLRWAIATARSDILTLETNPPF